MLSDLFEHNITLRGFVISENADQLELEQVNGATSHIPMPASSHISRNIKIPNAFLQSSSIGLLPVTVSKF